MSDPHPHLRIVHPSERHDRPWDRYVLGNPYTRFALMRYPESRWRFPWQRPLGGWMLGRWGLWWSR